MLKGMRFSLVGLMIGAFLGADAAHAAMGLPNGCKKDVFLTISGKIERKTNSTDGSYEMSEREFLALPTSTVTTTSTACPRSGT